MFLKRNYTSSFIFTFIAMMGVILLISHVSEALKCYNGIFIGIINQSTLNLTTITTSEVNHVCYSYKVAMDGVMNAFGEMTSTECSSIKAKSSPHFDVVCCSTDMCNTGISGNTSSASTATVSLIAMIFLLIGNIL